MTMLAELSVVNREVILFLYNTRYTGSFFSHFFLYTDSTLWWRRYMCVGNLFGIATLSQIVQDLLYGRFFTIWQQHMCILSLIGC